MADEILDAPGVAIGRPAGCRRRSQISEADAQAGVQECHHLQPLGQPVGVEDHLVEDHGIGPEPHCRAGRSVRRQIIDPLQRRLDGAAVAEAHRPAGAVAAHLQLEAPRQRVHDRDAHAVQATRHLVTAAAELAARVQHRHHHFEGRLLGHVRVRAGGDSPPVVNHLTGAVGIQGDVHLGAVAGHRLVHCVVDNLVDEMMQPGRTRGTDVHSGAPTNSLEALENGDVRCFVRPSPINHSNTSPSGSGSSQGLFKTMSRALRGAAHAPVVPADGVARPAPILPAPGAIPVGSADHAGAHELHSPVPQSSGEASDQSTLLQA